MAKKHLLTKEGLEKFQMELSTLKTVKKPEIIERIQEAVTHGDLSENADYAQAKEEQEMVESRIAQLEEIIKNTEIITKTKIKNTVTIGSTVRVRIDDGEKTYTIVGSGEANPSNGKISNESLVGSELIGRKAGEKVAVVTPSGTKSYEIVEIS